MIYQFNYPTRIQYGPGAVKLLPDALKVVGIRRPLIVTDKGLAPLPPVTGTVKLLEEAGLASAVFSGIWGNPVKSQVTAGVEAFRAHNADAIVALGGGAAIDVAKAIAVMVHHPGDLFDYEDDKPDARPMDKEIPYYVAIATTAGTGSEVGRSTVVSDDETHVKKIIFSPRLLAQRVFLDPDLTLALPPAVTAATGMDALTHLVESYLAKGFHPMADGIALEGLRILSRWLKPCVEYAKAIAEGDKELLDDDGHREARGMMLNAAMMGGVAFQKGLGVTHSLAHALSTVCDLHHGLANGIMIPYAMTFNREAVPQRLADLAAAVGAQPATAEGFVKWLVDFRASLGIPADLASSGVKKDHLDRLVQIAVADVCHANNPRKVSEPDFRAMFNQALP
ncbi:MAG TPA: iron-containing alcohol dehydrogenase [Polyangia bacterium]|nr:iron-containing alcohol dehydrogenase [Polyangia bacterium]